MEPAVIAAVLLAALLHASWAALVKAGSDRWLVPGIIIATGGIVGAIGACFLPLPQPQHWPWLVGSGLLHATYMTAMSHSFSLGDFGRIYPIARGTAPLIITIAAIPLLGEVPAPATALCLALLIVGLVGFVWQPGAVGGDPRALFFAFVTGLMIAAYSLVDAAGIRRLGMDLTPAVPIYLCWIMIFAALPFCTLALARRGGALVPLLRTDGLRGVAGGLVAMASYGIVIWAVARAPAAPVAALRETSIVFGALIATFALREGFGRRRFVAALFVAGGAAGLQLSG